LKIHNQSIFCVLNSIKYSLENTIAQTFHYENQKLSQMYSKEETQREVGARKSKTPLTTFFVMYITG
jgi:hypothetical protein